MTLTSTTIFCGKTLFGIYWKTGAKIVTTQKFTFARYWLTAFNRPNCMHPSLHSPSISRNAWFSVLLRTRKFQARLEKIALYLSLPTVGMTWTRKRSQRWNRNRTSVYVLKSFQTNLTLTTREQEFDPSRRCIALPSAAVLLLFSQVEGNVANLGTEWDNRLLINTLILWHKRIVTGDVERDANQRKFRHVVHVQCLPSARSHMGSS